jgi:hypothetical protein
MMDWPGAKIIAERLKKTLPPELRDPEDDEEQQPLPPEVQQQMAMMKQMVDQLQQQLNVAQFKIETKQVEMSSRERMEFAKLIVDLMKIEATLNSAEARDAFKHQLAFLQSQMANAAAKEAAARVRSRAPVELQSLWEQLHDQVSNYQSIFRGKEGAGDYPATSSKGRIDLEGIDR